MSNKNNLNAFNLKVLYDNFLFSITIAITFVAMGVLTIGVLQTLYSYNIMVNINELMMYIVFATFFNTVAGISIIYAIIKSIEIKKILNER